MVKSRGGTFRHAQVDSISGCFDAFRPSIRFCPYARLRHLLLAKPPPPPKSRPNDPGNFVLCLGDNPAGVFSVGRPGQSPAFASFRASAFVLLPCRTPPRAV